VDTNNTDYCLGVGVSCYLGLWQLEQRSIGDQALQPARGYLRYRSGGAMEVVIMKDMQSMELLTSYSGRYECSDDRVTHIPEAGFSPTGIQPKLRYLCLGEDQSILWLCTASPGRPLTAADQRLQFRRQACKSLVSSLDSIKISS